MPKPLRNILLFSLLLHVMAAYFSAGFYHSDEHFQILEFLNYKLGLSTSAALPIEFHEQIRPWLQPTLYLLLVKPFTWFGDWNPFHWVLAIRLFSSLLGWLSLCGLALLSDQWIQSPKLKKIALWLCAILWFIPALHARHSSENLSGSLFYLTFSILFLSETKLLARSTLFRSGTALGLGLLFGASFEFRYQVGFIVAGVYFYWMIFRRDQWGFLAQMLAGTFIAISLCTVLDHWGYETWTFAPWNYFHYNLVLNHVSDVDTHPVWDFFRSSFTETFPPLGPLLLGACVLSWIVNPLSPLTWASLPLFLVHTLIGHKELRFLFPIADASPFLAVMFLDSSNRLSRNFLLFLGSLPGRILLKVLLTIDIIALAASTLIPVWMPTRFFEQLYPVAHDKGYAKLLILYISKNPFDILGLPLNFYRPSNLETEHVENWEELRQKLAHDGDVWFFQVGDALPTDSGPLQDECTLQIGSLPSWAIHVIRSPSLERFTHRVTNWTLYHCQIKLETDLSN